jgi:hypothetical protein
MWMKFLRFILTIRLQVFGSFIEVIVIIRGLQAARHPV